jgi:hypothetical protein
MNYYEFFEEIEVYKNWAFDSFAVKGLKASENNISEHKVLFLKTKNSTLFEESNFENIKEILGNHAEIFRFNHWGCVYFELILISPNVPDEIKEKCGEILYSLSEYPILNESHYSDLRFEKCFEYWDSLSKEERKQELRENNVKENLKEFLKGEKFPEFLFNEIY